MFSSHKMMSAPAIDGVFSKRECSYQEVVNHLNLTQNKELYYMTRPVKNYKRPTVVSLELLLYAILDVVEKDQKFIPYVWTFMRWHNEYISWNPDEFCGIKTVSLPVEILWKPDLTIEEMTEKDKAPPSPYLSINYEGEVEVQNNQVLISTCRLHIYEFPFDKQSCTLSFKSVMHSGREIQLHPIDNSAQATEWSREVMRTQNEWLFVGMSVETNNSSYIVDQTTIVYSITMKRRSILYIANFLLPVLFFLCLDLASFLISDSGGEKLAYKVTVLLAVTVMQLILNEILPSTSDRIPLIAVYCIGIFSLMLLSLLEIIVVMHLMAKDSHASKDHVADGGRSSKVRKWTCCACTYGGSNGDTPSEQPLHVAKEADSSTLTDHRDLETLSVELREMEKTLCLLLNNGKEEEKPGYWTGVAKKVNKYFFVFYVTMLSLFLTMLFFRWTDT
ncbi:5-hydroxytryptamine receptor 3A-like [Spinachia spinachia]